MDATKALSQLRDLLYGPQLMDPETLEIADRFRELDDSLSAGGQLPDQWLYSQETWSTEQAIAYLGLSSATSFEGWRYRMRRQGREITPQHQPHRWLAQEIVDAKQMMPGKGNWGAKK